MQILVRLVARVSLGLTVGFVFLEGYFLGLSLSPLQWCGMGLGVHVCGCVLVVAHGSGPYLYVGCVVVVEAF